MKAPRRSITNAPETHKRTRDLGNEIGQRTDGDPGPDANKLGGRGGITGAESVNVGRTTEFTRSPHRRALDRNQTRTEPLGPVGK